VGETALRVSRRRLEPFPKVRTWWVSRRSEGRWERAGWRGVNMGSWVVVAMMCVGASRGLRVGAMECDIVESIMRAVAMAQIRGQGAGASARRGVWLLGAPRVLVVLLAADAGGVTCAQRAAGGGVYTARPCSMGRTTRGWRSARQEETQTHTEGGAQ
jgi:hypothetical protein